MTEPMFDLDAAIVEARRSSTRTMWIVVVGVPVLAILTVVAVWFAASGRTAAQDSFNATAVQLAGQARSACITERRNEQLAAQGEELAALGRSLIAAFIAEDTDEALAQVAKFEAAANRQEAAAAHVAPDVLNEPPPEGCGPPVVDVDDLEEAR